MTLDRTRPGTDRSGTDRTARRAWAVFLAGIAALSVLLAGCGLDSLLATPTPAGPTATPTPFSLSEDALSAALAAGLEAGETKIDLSALAIPGTYQEQVYAVFAQVLATHPAAYRCRGTLEYDLTSIDDGKTWTIRDVKPGYQPQSVLDAADRWIAETGAASASPRERVRLLHDKVVLSTSYDTAAAEAGDAALPAFSAAGVFEKGKAVCQGYAEALNVLLNRAGVPTVYASGSAKGIAHAWVLVQLDGKWYHVDATFDDPVPDTPGQTNYLYFLMDDAAIGKDHIRDLAVPACTDATHAWMWAMQDAVRLPDGRFAYSDATADGTVSTIGADGGGRERIPFRRYGKTYKTTRGYFLCVAKDGAIYLSNYSDGATIYRRKAGETVLTVFAPAGYPDGISSAKDLRIVGTNLTFDLMDDKGNVTGSGSVPLG